MGSLSSIVMASTFIDFLCIFSINKLIAIPFRIIKSAQNCIVVTFAFSRIKNRDYIHMEIHSSTSLKTLKKINKNVVHPAQKAFIRHTKKIKGLQEEQKQMLADLDALFHMYHADIKPIEIQLHGMLTECITIGYNYYKNSKKFTKKERAFLKQWMLSQADWAASLVDFSLINEDLKKIIKELDGFDYDEKLAAEFEEMKQELSERCERDGIKVDLSSIKFKGSMEDAMRDLFGSIGEAHRKQKEFFENDNTEEIKKDVKKSKKQLEKEERMAAQQEIQIQSTHAIYKKLVKALHPDLEQDSHEKIRKEELMKRVTTAYDKKDLFELLNIELEWMNSTQQLSSFKIIYQDNQLKIYNEILKDQIKDLKALNDTLPFHPRFAQLQRYYGGQYFFAPAVKYNFNDFRKRVQYVQGELAKMRTDDEALAVLKGIVKDMQNTDPAQEIIEYISSALL